jgi:hypothetical protein
LYNGDEYVTQYSGALICSNALMYFAWQVRHEKDPLEIKAELAYAFPLALPIGSTGTLGILFDTYLNNGAVGDAAVVQFEWFLLLCTMWIHFYQCPLQVIKARRYGRIQGLPTTQEFVTMLDNPTFYKMFEARCVNEFSVENLKFYRSVEVEFKQKYHMLKASERDAVARAIYKCVICLGGMGCGAGRTKLTPKQKNRAPTNSAYVSSGSVMEINIKSLVRKPLEDIFGGGNEPSDLPIEVFDAAQSEILDLMKRVSFLIPPAALPQPPCATRTNAHIRTCNVQMNSRIPSAVGFPARNTRIGPRRPWW